MSSQLNIFIGSVDLNPSNVAETAFTTPTQPDLSSIEDSIDIKLKRSDLVHVLGNMRVSNCFASDVDCTFQADPNAASAVFTGLPSEYGLSNAMVNTMGLPAGTSYTTTDDATVIDLTRQNELLHDAATTPQRGALMRTLLPRLGRSSALLPNGLGDVDTVSSLLVASGVDNLTKWIRADDGVDEFTLKDGTKTSFNTLMTVGAGTTNTVTYHLENGASGAVDGNLGHEVIAALVNAHHPDATNTAENGASSTGDNLWQKDADNNVSLVKCPDDGVVLTVVVKSSLEVNLSHSGDIPGDEDPNGSGSLKCDQHPDGAIEAVDGGSADPNRVLMKVNIAFTEGDLPVEVQADDGYWFPVFVNEQPGMGTQTWGDDNTTYWTNLTKASSTTAEGPSSEADLVDKRSALLTNVVLKVEIHPDYKGSADKFVASAGTGITSKYPFSTASRMARRIMLGNSRTKPSTDYYHGKGTVDAHVIYVFDQMEQGDYDIITEAITARAGDYDAASEDIFVYNYYGLHPVMTGLDLLDAVPSYSNGDGNQSYAETMVGISDATIVDNINGSTSFTLNVFNNMEYNEFNTWTNKPFYVAIYEYEPFDNTNANHTTYSTSSTIDQLDGANIDDNGVLVIPDTDGYKRTAINSAYSQMGFVVTKLIALMFAGVGPSSTETITATKANTTAGAKYMAIADPIYSVNYGGGMGELDDNSIITTVLDPVTKTVMERESEWLKDGKVLVKAEHNKGFLFASDKSQNDLVTLANETLAESNLATYITAATAYPAEYAAWSAAQVPTINSGTAIYNRTIDPYSGNSNKYNIALESFTWDAAADKRELSVDILYQHGADIGSSVTRDVTLYILKLDVAKVNGVGELNNQTWWGSAKGANYNNIVVSGGISGAPASSIPPEAVRATYYNWVSFEDAGVRYAPVAVYGEAQVSLSGDNPNKSITWKFAGEALDFEEGKYIIVANMHETEEDTSTGAHSLLPTGENDEKGDLSDTATPFVISSYDNVLFFEINAYASEPEFPTLIR